MSQTKVKLEYSGFNAFRKSSAMQSFLASLANDIQGRAGQGYATDAHMMRTRAIASVYTETYEARKDQSDNNTLLKAVK